MRPTMLFVFAFFVACASAPTTLQRGALTRPPPAQQRPGVGLPQPHLPGQHVGPKVEPNPRPKRYLPPTPGGGPGIWASKAPTASDDEPVEIALKPPAILGVALPLPEADDDGLIRAEPEWACAGTMSEAAKVTTRVHSRFSGTRLRCLAAQLYLSCTETLVEAEFYWQHMGESFDAARQHEYLSAKLRAELFVAHECDGAERRDQIDDAERLIMQNWLLIMKGRARNGGR